MPPLWVESLVLGGQPSGVRPQFMPKPAEPLTIAEDWDLTSTTKQQQLKQQQEQQQKKYSHSIHNIS